MSDNNVVRIKPNYYIHVLDNNSGVTSVLVGPQTFTRQEHQKLLLGPEQMVMIPPRHYAVILNPVVRNEKNEPLTDKHGNYRVRHMDEEIRFEQEPFPLYPSEKLRDKIAPLQVVPPDTALRLRATRDFQWDAKTVMHAGDEWLYLGPGTYKPRVEVKVVELIRATIIKPNQALKIKATKETKDKRGNLRKVGEEWLEREPGAYLPGVNEEIVKTVNAFILTEKKALHLLATRTFTDVYGKERKAGEEWLITLDEADTHIPDIYEQVVGEVAITTLTNRQYAVVVDPIGPNGKPQLGKRQLRKGPTTFFLRPGEQLENGIQNIYILGEEEALLLRAKEAFKDTSNEKEPIDRRPGDLWMIEGPTDYTPVVEVEVVEKRKSIPLDETEGVYVRDINTGKVTSMIGKSYLLRPNEELWEKELPQVVEDLLSAASGLPQQRGKSSRDKTRVVTYRAPHNSAVQIYDFKEKKSRVVLGPSLVMLGPDEHFTILSLSGDKPKRPHVIKSIALQLGPEFMTDIVTVETSDHARLSLKLSYNWSFDIGANNENLNKVFQVPDFVGDACKAIASRVRGTVASVRFDDFHKGSAAIIRGAVFGPDKNKSFVFKANNLLITNIDIQSVEPVDQRTRDSLQKSVQLAIEITTKSQEASARHDAQRLEQEARGKLERQKILDEAEAEKARTALLQLQAHSAAVQSTGQATAEAKARAESANIEGEAAIKQAQLKAEATEIESNTELAQLVAMQTTELEHQRALAHLELSKAKQLAAIEAQKFKSIVKTIGPDTIGAIATAGPKLQADLLHGLGLKSFLITDGNSPVNLFNTAAGLIGSATSSTE
jgi:major vault protein